MRLAKDRTTDIFSTIERLWPDLPPALKTVATFVLKRREAIGALSISEVAEASNVSEATVVRFCKALGFRGFRDLQRKMVHIHTWPTETGGADPTLGASTDLWDDPRITLSALAESVQSTRRTLRQSALLQAAHHLAKAHCITWFGLSDSGCLALSANHRSFISAINSRALTDASDVIHLAKQLTSDDVLVCISRSGRLPHLVKAIRHVKENTATPIIAITGDPGSPLAQLADVQLISSPVDLYIDEQRITLQTAQMVAVDTLIAATLRLRFRAVEIRGVAMDATTQAMGGTE